MAGFDLNLLGDDRDPLGVRRAFGGGLLGRGRRMPYRQEAQFPALPADEAEPLKDQLLRRTASGLSYLGTSLDKAFGARALRGLAAGKPHELLSIVPFSDTLGITRPEDSVSMDELLTKHYPVFSPNDPTRWEFRDFAVPLLEIAADPGSYINPLGASTKLGRVASGLGKTQSWSRRALTEGYTHLEPALRAAGHTPEQIGHLANAGARIADQETIDAALKAGINLQPGMPLRGALGVSWPFSGKSLATGSGPVGRWLAGRQDALARGIAKTPPVPQLRALFDANVLRAVNPGIQEAASRFGVPAREAVHSAVRSGEYQLREDLRRIIAPFKQPGMEGLEPEALRVVHGVAESSPIFGSHPQWEADLVRRHGLGLTAPGMVPADVARHIGTHWDQLRRMGESIRRFGEQVLPDEARLGLKPRDLSDIFATYAARRHIAEAPDFGGSEVARQFPTMHASHLKRKEPLKNIPGATPQIDEWAMDPRLSGPARTLSPADVEAVVLADMLRVANLAPPATGPYTATSFLGPINKTFAQKAHEVAAWLGGLDPAHAANRIPFFNTDAIGDYVMRGMRHAGVAGGATAAIRASTGMARPIAEFINSGEKHVPLGDFLSGKANPNPNLWTGAVADPTSPTGASLQGALVRAYEQMAPHGFGPVDQALLTGPYTKLLQDLNQFGLRQGDANDIAAYLTQWLTPTEMKPILGFTSGAHQFFKNMVYPLWLPSHIRNLTSAAYNNMLHGTMPGDYLDALRIMHQGVVKDPMRYALTAGMTPQDAAHVLNRQAYADAKIYSGINSFQERVGAGGLEDPKLLAGLAGQRQLTPLRPGVHPPLREVIAEHGAQNWNPLAQAGVLGNTEDKWLPLVIGRRVGSGTEDFVRLANYLGNLRQGMNSSQAGLLSRGIHFDYTALTPFERNVMKQLVPFYTFMRFNLPYQLKMAATRPGSVSPVLHAMGATDPNREWVPEYLASGAAIPLGAEQDGTRRYLGSFGLPLEEAFQRFKFVNKESPLPWGDQVSVPDLGNMIGAYLGEGSPYAKLAVEWATGHQLKTGRKLKDLYSKGLAGGFGAIPEEYAQPLTHLAANSPLARFFSFGSTLGDARKDNLTKAVNLLSGVRLTDVDMEKQRAAAMRAAINDMLGTDPRVREFIDFYIRPEDRATLAPELREKMRIFTTLKNEAKAFHVQKQRAEELEKKRALGVMGGF